MSQPVSFSRLSYGDRRIRTTASVLAGGAHIGLALLVLSLTRPAPPKPHPRVVLVEIPTEARLSATNTPAPAKAQPTPTAPSVPLPVPSPLPSISIPLPNDLPPLPVLPLSPPARQAAPAPVTPAAAPSPAAPSPTGAGSGTSPQPDADPRARAIEVDYFSQVSAYLNRRKTYPVEARQARAEGVVVVRFTVDRDGAVSGVAIKRGSGYDLLDQATLALLERVAPLPRMPASMQRQTVTLALPIAYSLKTS